MTLGTVISSINAEYVLLSCFTRYADLRYWFFRQYHISNQAQKFFKFFFQFQSFCPKTDGKHKEKNINCQQSCNVARIQKKVGYLDNLASF